MRDNGRGEFEPRPPAPKAGARALAKLRYAPFSTNNKNGKSTGRYTMRQALVKYAKK